MITYKVKMIFDSKEVYDFWVGQMRLVRECYNFVSKIAFEEKIDLNLKAFHARMYREERKEFPLLPAQMCIKVYKQVLANYKTARSNRHKTAKPLVMSNPCVQLDKRLYSGMTRDSFKISGGNGNHRTTVRFMTYQKFNDLASVYRMCDPLVKYEERNGEFYACVPFLAIPTTPFEESYLGVDLGIKRLATLSNGKAFTDKKYLGERRRIRHIKRKLQEHKKTSHSARMKLKKLRRKEQNVSKNMCHHLANAILAEQGSVIVMEDLFSIKQNTSKTEDGFKRTRHNNVISQVPFYRLRTILSYKTPLAGKRVETVSPEYTSQEDCRTQSRDGCSRVGCRFHTADGLVFDADWNASINIRNRYKHSDSFILPIDGKLNLNDRFCQRTNSELASPACKHTALDVCS